MCWNVNEVKCDKMPEVSIGIKKKYHHSDLCVCKPMYTSRNLHTYAYRFYVFNKKKVKLNPHKLTL